MQRVERDGGPQGPSTHHLTGAPDRQETYEEQLSGLEAARVLGPEAVSRLLARLAHLAVPDGLVVLTREELSRLEERAYAMGWQDSTAYQCAVVGGGRLDAGAPPVRGPGPELPDPVGELREFADGEPAGPAEPTGAEQDNVLRFPHPIPLVGASDVDRAWELMAHRRRRPKGRRVPRPRPEDPEG